MQNFRKIAGTVFEKKRNGRTDGRTGPILYVPRFTTGDQKDLYSFLVLVARFLRKSVTHGRTHARDRFYMSLGLQPGTNNSVCSLDGYITGALSRKAPIGPQL